MAHSGDLRQVFTRLFLRGERRIKYMAEVVGISLRTAYQWRDILLSGQRLETHYAKPPKRKFTPAVRRSLAQLLRQNPRKSARWLTEKLNEQRDVKVSLSGVQKS
jgi:transposase